MCIWTPHIRCIPKTFLRFPVLSVCIICLLLHNINKAERLHSYRKGSDFIGKLEDVTFNGMYHKKEIKPLSLNRFSVITSVLKIVIY